MIDELGTNITSILSDFNSLSNSSSVYNTTSTPSSIPMKAEGLYSIQSLNFLFSPTVDKIVDTLLDICINGNFDNALTKLDQFVQMFNKMGVGQGFFNGEIGSHVITTIKASVNSMKFNRTSNKIKKVLIVLKNLKREAKKFKDPIQRQKYEDALYAINSIITVIAQIYKHREKLNARVLRGLSNIVFESTNDETIQIGKITY
jgi:hypothetical protein